MGNSIQQVETTETLIRWSRPWWFYMVWRLGFLRAAVNGIEDTLAITGRLFLLVFLVYCGGKAGMWLSHPDYKFNEWLELGMFILQLAGLEGAMPGLARQAERLRLKDDYDGARRVDNAMRSARVMTWCSIGEGALHALGMPGMQYISAILLIARGVVITGFLIELAKIESKGPRVISRSEYEQEQAAQSRQSNQGVQSPHVQGVQSPHVQGVQRDQRGDQSVTTNQGDQGVQVATLNTDQATVNTVNTPTVITSEQFGTWSPGGDLHQVTSTELGIASFTFQETAPAVPVTPAPTPAPQVPPTEPPRQQRAPQAARKVTKKAEKPAATRSAAITDISTRARKTSAPGAGINDADTLAKIRQAMEALPSDASNRAIARAADVSPATVLKHREHIQAEIDRARMISGQRDQFHSDHLADQEVNTGELAAVR